MLNARHCFAAPDRSFVQVMSHAPNRERGPVAGGDSPERQFYAGDLPDQYTDDRPQRRGPRRISRGSNYNYDC